MGFGDTLFLDKHICVNLSLPVAVFQFLIIQDHSDALEGTLLSEISVQILAQLGRESSIRFYRGLLKV